MYARRKNSFDGKINGEITSKTHSKKKVFLKGPSKSVAIYFFFVHLKRIHLHIRSIKLSIIFSSIITRLSRTFNATIREHRSKSVYTLMVLCVRWSVKHRGRPYLFVLARGSFPSLFARLVNISLVSVSSEFRSISGGHGSPFKYMNLHPRRKNRDEGTSARPPGDELSKFPQHVPHAASDSASVLSTFSGDRLPRMESSWLPHGSPPRPPSGVLGRRFISVGPPLSGGTET